jgi:hypothetical protein
MSALGGFFPDPTGGSSSSDGGGDSGILGSLIGVINAVGTNVATVYHSVSTPTQRPTTTLPSYLPQSVGGISSGTIILFLVVGLGAFLLVKAAK